MAAVLLRLLLSHTWLDTSGSGGSSSHTVGQSAAQLGHAWQFLHVPNAGWAFRSRTNWRQMQRATVRQNAEDIIRQPNEQIQTCRRRFSKYRTLSLSTNSGGKMWHCKLQNAHHTSLHHFHWNNSPQTHCGARPYTNSA